jgi:hypothetical protein
MLLQAAVRAANGDQGCKILNRSLHRLAAIQILERFQELFLEVVGEGLRAMGCIAVSGSAQEGTSHEQQSSRAVAAAADKWRAKAQSNAEGSVVTNVSIQCMWAALRGLVKRSSVLEMAAGEMVHLSASAVLVGGSVVATQNSKAQQKGEGGKKAVALSPCVLVWPEHKSGALEKAPKVPLRAGMLLKSRFPERGLPWVVRFRCFMYPCNLHEMVEYFCDLLFYKYIAPVCGV